MCMALEYANELFNTAEHIKGEWKELHNKLSTTDKKVSDIEHFIEFNTLNAANGYKAYKLLKEVLEERREIKNQIEELRVLYDFINVKNLFNNKYNQSIKDKIKSKNDINTSITDGKKYQVRVLTELFGSVM